LKFCSVGTINTSVLNTKYSDFILCYSEYFLVSPAYRASILSQKETLKQALLILDYLPGHPRGKFNLRRLREATKHIRPDLVIAYPVDFSAKKNLERATSIASLICEPLGLSTIACPHGVSFKEVQENLKRLLEITPYIGLVENLEKVFPRKEMESYIREDLGDSLEDLFLLNNYADFRSEFRAITADYIVTDFPTRLALDLRRLGESLPEPPSLDPLRDSPILEILLEENLVSATRFLRGKI